MILSASYRYKIALTLGLCLLKVCMDLAKDWENIKNKCNLSHVQISFF